ncbi:hypothetical protein EC957_010843 [Mortierella hygrophila]|uniref:Uncharacterized protein n=1 Tax=Mortierella hygrophila TaxID=979708 RepID=A0A9P6FAA4_9FUNG|nr:hypothetical protein EC957_010843 [Mortierella hygrophila]
MTTPSSCRACPGPARGSTARCRVDHDEFYANVDNHHHSLFEEHLVEGDGSDVLRTRWRNVWIPCHFGSSTGDESLRVLKSYPALERLMITQNVEAEAGARLANAIREHYTLTQLRFKKTLRISHAIIQWILTRCLALKSFTIENRMDKRSFITSRMRSRLLGYALVSKNSTSGLKSRLSSFHSRVMTNGQYIVPVQDSNQDAVSPNKVEAAANAKTEGAIVAVSSSPVEK